MQILGFENYAEVLKVYLVKYREVRTSVICLFFFLRKKNLFFVLRVHVRALDSAVTN